MKDDRFWILLGKKESGTASVEELSELEGLIRERGAHDFSGELIHRLWQTPLKILPDDESEDTVWKHVRERMSVSKEHRRKTGLFRLGKWVTAAACVLFVGTSIWIYAQYAGKKKNHDLVAEADTRVNHIATQPLAKSKLELPDGTQVWLNEKSRLVYDNRDFNVNGREVTLTGEAFFEVTKNEQLPFIIHAGKVNIRVLGTAFNVKAYAGQTNVETSLIRGKIAVSYAGDPDHSIQLKAHQKILVPIDQPLHDVPKQKIAYTILPLTVDKQGDALETAWMKGKLVFDNESFQNIAQRMKDWYGIDFYFANDSLKELHFSGVIDKETFQDALKAMQLSRHFTFRIKDKQLWIGK